MGRTQGNQKRDLGAGWPDLPPWSEDRLLNLLHFCSARALAWLLADGITIALGAAGTGIFGHGLKSSGLFPALALQHDFAFFNAHHLSFHHVLATDAFARVF